MSNLQDYLSIFVWRNRATTNEIEVLLQHWQNQAAWWFPSVPISQPSEHGADGMVDQESQEKLLKQEFGIDGKLRNVRRIKHCAGKFGKAFVLVYDFEFERNFNEQLPQSFKWMSLDEMQALATSFEPLLTDEPLKFACLLLGQSAKDEPIFAKVTKKSIKLDEKSLGGLDHRDVFSNFVAKTWPGDEMTLATFESSFDNAGNSFKLWQAFQSSSPNPSRLKFKHFLRGLAVLNNFNKTSSLSLFDQKVQMTYRYFADEQNGSEPVLTAREMNDFLGTLTKNAKNNHSTANLFFSGDATISQEAMGKLLREHFLEPFNKFNFFVEPSVVQSLITGDSILKPMRVLSPKAFVQRTAKAAPKLNFEEVKAICAKSSFFLNKLTAAERSKFLDALGCVAKEMGTNPASIKQEQPVAKLKKFVLQGQIVTLRRTSHQLSMESSPIATISGDKTSNIAKTEQNQLAKEALNLLNDFLVEERCSSAKGASSVSLYSFIFKWRTQSSHQQFLQLIPRLVDACEPLFAAEQRLVRLESPCYVAGDFHGNFHDLQTLAHFFWRYGPNFCPAKLLFLGDYVDRGPNALELLAYLMAQKLLAPDRVFLLRGNHDDVKTNMDFLSSCSEAFLAAHGDHPSVRSEEFGRLVWLHVNRLFAALPLAALIDQSIFCTHAGIPSSRSGFTSLDDFNNSVMPTRLESLYDNDLALELCWNDPLLPEHAKLLEVQQNLEDFKDGFTVNVQRSPSQHRDTRILYWTTQAFKTFLAEHKIQFFVRAQESYRRGTIGKEPRMITVACSEAAFNATVLLVDQGKLQLLRVNTQLTIQELKNGEQSQINNGTSLFEPTGTISKQVQAKIDAAKKMHRSLNPGQKLALNPYLPPIADEEFEENNVVLRQNAKNSVQQSAQFPGPAKTLNRKNNKKMINVLKLD